MLQETDLRFLVLRPMVHSNVAIPIVNGGENSTPYLAHLVLWLEELW